MIILRSVLFNILFYLNLVVLLLLALPTLVLPRQAIIEMARLWGRSSLWPGSSWVKFADGRPSVDRSRLQQMGDTKKSRLAIPLNTIIVSICQVIYRRTILRDRSPLRSTETPSPRSCRDRRTSGQHLGLQRTPSLDQPEGRRSRQECEQHPSFRSAPLPPTNMAFEPT